MNRFHEVLAQNHIISYIMQILHQNMKYIDRYKWYKFKLMVEIRYIREIVASRSLDRLYGLALN